MLEDTLIIKTDDLNPKEDRQPIINKKFERKKSYLKRQIIIGFAVSGICLIIFAAIFFYNQNIMTEKKATSLRLAHQISELKSKSNNIESRFNDVKKYKPIWLEANERKKDFDGIKISSVSDTFKEMAKKNDISNFSINISAPENLKEGNYANKTFDVNLVHLKLSFVSFTDQSAMNFIEEILDMMPGYILINDVSFKQNKKEFYSDSELVKISTGEIKGSISTNISFYWYFLKYTENDKK